MLGIKNEQVIDSIAGDGLAEQCLGQAMEK